MSPVVLVAGAYLLGSIPFSFVVARLFGVKDVRKVGSGNVGATNVMRSAGRVPGTIAFVLDFLKGAAAAVIAARTGAGEPWPAVCATAAVIGHMYPVWLGFHGGKGVATGAGAFLPLAPWAALGALCSFPLAAALTRMVSVGSLAGAAVLVTLSFLIGYPPSVTGAAGVVSALIFWKHRGNLARIRAGNENRIGARRAGEAVEP